MTVLSRVASQAPNLWTGQVGTARATRAHISHTLSTSRAIDTRVATHTNTRLCLFCVARMFILWTVRDSIRVSPPLMRLDWPSVLSDEIDSRYANRVLSGVGLVICLVDILACGDAVLPPGDGAAHADGAIARTHSTRVSNAHILILMRPRPRRPRPRPPPSPSTHSHV